MNKKDSDNSLSKLFSFSFKDSVAIILSVLAFTVSVLSFYYSNIRTRDNLAARVIDMDSGLDSNNVQGLMAQIAFVNSGNRQAIVSTIGYSFQRPTSDTVTKSSYGAFGRNYHRIKPFPFILPPNEMRLVDFFIPCDQLFRRLSFVTPVFDSISNDTIYNFECALNFTSVDSRGEVHFINGPYIEAIEIDKEFITRFGPLNDTTKLNPYPLTTLHSN